jgi:hypothetical protein
MNHDSIDGLKCKRCGIEKIYWEHFPNCSRFKPSWDVVRTAFKEQPPSEDSTMTPDELKQFDEWIKRVQDGLEERNAPPALRERVKENHEKMRAYLQQESEREAENPQMAHGG